jgi:Ala-tRNA(Pro) deacylase
MATAITVSQFLQDHHLAHDVLSHPRTSTSVQSARAAHIDPSRLVKAVLLEEDGCYVMAVLPASHHIHLGRMRVEFGRSFGMATEHTVSDVFKDCAPGAIPALGPAYGIETIWDESLRDATEVFLEAGDHEHLLRMNGPDYLGTLQGCQHGSFGDPLERSATH